MTYSESRQTETNPPTTATATQSEPGFKISHPALHRESGAGPVRPVALGDYTQEQESPFHDDLNLYYLVKPAAVWYGKMAKYESFKSKF